MAVFLVFCYLLVITPVRFGAAIFWQGQARGAVAALVWGVRVQVRFSLCRDGQGHLRLLTDFHGRRKPAAPGPPPPGVIACLKALKRANVGRFLLKRGVRLRDFAIDAEIGGGDAAFIALCTALLRALGALPHGPRVRARPVFQGNGSLKAQCIAEARLGTLLLAGALGLWSLLRSGKKEEKAWNVPSET